MIINNQLKKAYRNKKPSATKQFSSIIINFQQIIKQCLNLNQSTKFDEFFNNFDIKCVNKIWKQSSQLQKMEILTKIEFKAFQQNQNICIFKQKKQIKQILILISGQCSYKLQVANKYMKFPYITKSGQLLGQFYNCQYSKFKQFSIIAETKCIVLKFSNNSYLKEKLCLEKQLQMSLFQKKLCQYIQTKQNQKQFLSLVPYFSSCSFYRSEKICQQKVKISNIRYFCYLIEGIIQISKQSKHLSSPISLATLNQGQFFHTCEQYQLSQTFILTCKSNYCRIFTIPFEIIKQNNNTIAICLNQQNTFFKSLHLKIFTKCQKILQNPRKVFKKNRSKTKKERIHSQKAISWDLIGFFTNMKRTPKVVGQQRQVKKYSKSAHCTRRQFLNKNLIPSLEKLKKEAQKQNLSYQKDKKQEEIYSNNFKVRLNNTNNKHISNFRSISTCPIKQSRSNLLKKTKFKLIRYAKGQNFYGLNNYL